MEKEKSFKDIKHYSLKVTLVVQREDVDFDPKHIDENFLSDISWHYSKGSDNHRRKDF